MLGIFSGAMPIFWLAAAIAFTVTEVATYQMIAIWFALGSVVAMIAAALGAGTTVQMILFVLTSALALAVTRPFLKKVVKPKTVHTNADQAIGAIGTVVHSAANGEKGRVMVNGLEWAAREEGSGTLEVGEKVKILAIEGVTLVVKKEEQTV